MKLLVKTLAGLEDVLAQEITHLGGQNITVIKRGVTFEGDKRLLYRACLELRTALRVLMPIATFQATDDKILYDNIKKIDWTQYINVSQTIAVDAVVYSTYFTHSQYVALKTKDAIVDLFREKHYKRPNVNTLTPDLLVNIHITNDEVTVSLDASGDSLHKRGYRVDSLDAPINEVLAAGLIALSGWDGKMPFIDAMCGSGTILIEAAQKAHNIPPQYGRDYFCFKRWKDFDKALFDDIVKTQAAQRIDYQGYIAGSDLNFQAIRVAERNIEAAQLTGKIPVVRKDFFKYVPDMGENTEGGILLMNPPYDERLKIEDAQNFYKQIGDTMKKNWKGWQVFIISSNLEAAKHIGLKTSRKIPLFNGSLECRLLKFEVY